MESKYNDLAQVLFLLIQLEFYVSEKKEIHSLEREHNIFIYIIQKQI